MEQLAFLTEEKIREIGRRFCTPVFVYDQETLEARARDVLDFPHAYGLTARYAMKALPTAAVVRILNQAGLHIDASSGYEVERAMRAGVPPEQIQLTAQRTPRNLENLVRQGVIFNACSLQQLRTYGELFPGRSLTVRINPGLGSGHSKRTNVGGPSASFGIWHEYLDEVLAISRACKLKISSMHTHIGSGSDPEVWEHCALISLRMAARLPEVKVLSLGGGFKVGRMAGEASTDLKRIGLHVQEAFRAFGSEHGRRLRLEVEPGTFLVANAGVLICSVIDCVDTGKDGYDFLKVDAGMTEVLRISLYGAQHPIAAVPAHPGTRRLREYLIAGHCCESGDVLTPAPGDPEGLRPRLLAEARTDDLLAVGGSGAYCSSMASKNYNSFPEAAEVLQASDGTLHLIRKRQTLEQITVNEVMPDFLDAGLS